MTDRRKNAFFLRDDIATLWGDQDSFAAAEKQRGIVYREKEGRRTLRFEYNGRGYFLKLHRGIGWKEIFKNLLQGRLPVLGAENEYRAIRAFEAIGIDTLSVAAYGKRGIDPSTQQSYLVTDELTGVQSLEDYCTSWSQQPPAFALKRKLIERVASVARIMHENGINHRDFYLCHFLLENHPSLATAVDVERRKLYLMDLHRAQIRDRVPARWLIKDLGGLYYSALDIGLNRRDIFRFMRAYSNKPLRELFAGDGDFWVAVRERARRIYVRDHEREPQSPAWMSTTPWLDAFLRGERHLSVPATLPLLIDGKIRNTRVLSILRLLPGKRLVVKAMLDNQIIVAKLFVRSHSSKRHLERERIGHTSAHNAGVSCPKFLGVCATACGRFDTVLYEFIAAAPLGSHWKAFDLEQKQIWLKRLLDIMLALHKVGAYQTDIHADNFLFRDNELFLLDLGSIAVHDAPLSTSKSVQNLAALVAQFTFAERKLFADPLIHYCTQRGWQDRKKILADIEAALESCWQVRKRDYLDKALRECKLTSFRRSFTRLQVVRRDWLGEDIDRFCRDPDAFITAGELLKAGNTATVVKSTINAKPVVIKRYNIKHWRHAISRGLRQTRAQHSWLYAHWLELAGIESTKPIALFEKRFGFWHGAAYFVCSWIDAADLLSTGQQRALTEKELRDLQILFDAMHVGRLSHGDFKANNLLLDTEGVALIDLDAMREHSTTAGWRRAFGRDLSRLMRNWQPDREVYTQVKSIIQRIFQFTHRHS